MLSLSNHHNLSGRRPFGIRKTLFRSLVLLLMLIAAIGGNAQSLRQDSDGSYIIASKEDYITYMSNKGYWKEKVIQVVDIDLGGMTITPVGFDAGESKAFSGTYDGQGHTISNAVMYWDIKGEGNALNYGMFGYVDGTSSQATICNLTIKNFTITRSSAAPEEITSGTNDVKMGILAGRITERSAIHDISLIGCRITDGGMPTKLKAIMCGGAVGDALYNTGTISTPFANANFKFVNIFAQVDIDLSKTSKIDAQASDPQMFAGGILGRFRTPSSTSVIPNNTIYTGTIKFPLGSTSPTVDNMRYNDTGNNAANLVLTYAGEVGNKGDAVGKKLTDAEYDAFIATRTYYNYKSYDSNAGSIKDVNSALPDNGSYMYKTRTFLPNATATSTPISVNFASDPKEWARVQGVNWGSCIVPSGTEMIDELNDAVTETLIDSSEKRYYWEWDATNQVYVLKSRLDLSQDVNLIIESNSDASAYTAKLVLKYTETEMPELEAEGTFQWQKTSDVSDDSSWADIPGATSKTFDNVLLGNYYRVVWTHTSDTPVLYSDYRSPRTTVYLFDEPYTRNYMEWFPEESRFDYLFPAGTCIYPDGNDTNDGSSPDKAVRTMARAYELLLADGDINTNRIVIIGYTYDPDYLSMYTAKVYGKPASITGADNLYSLSGGILGMISRSDSEAKELQAPLRIDKIALHGAYNYRISGSDFSTLLPFELNRDGTPKSNHLTSLYLFLSCNLYDLTIDQDVEMLGYDDATTSWGLPLDIQSLPKVTIMGGIEDKNDILDLSYPVKKGYYSVKGYAVITLRSGVYGRLILGGRNDGNASRVTHNVQGSPTAPVRTKLTVNISDINHDNLDTSDDRSKYGRRRVDRGFEVNGHPTYKYSPYCYSHDVGLIAGGQTDGTVYGDMEISVRNGYIARVMAGSITFGRAVGGLHPSDSFFGRAIINVYGALETFTDTDDIVKEHYTTTINEIYGGTLGRRGSVSPSTPEVNAYFYGKSYINIYGGRIGSFKNAPSKAVADAQYDGQTKAESSKLIDFSKQIPNIYGAGGGGASGIGNATYHTTDACIPYLDPSGTLCYGDYATASAPGNSYPEMTFGINTSKPQTYSLDETETYINIYGGYIEGNVYGGGFGYSNNIIDYKVLPGYTIDRAYVQAGMLYGNSYVTMARNADIRPAVVHGNIYGGGAGDSRYITAAPEGEKWKFSRIATQYGNSYVSLTAGTVGDGITSEGGNVFGGSMGIAGYEDIASVYGKSEIVVDGATIYGNIFGGCSLANLRKSDAENSGNAYATIQSGTIGNNIFGGSQGQVGDGSSVVDSKAIIEGDTYVDISGGEFLGNPYIDISDIDKVDANGQVFKTIKGVSTAINIIDHKEYYRTFNIYGGGYLNCDVKGTSHLNVTSSLLSHLESFVDPRQNPNALTLDPDSVFKSAYMDVTFRRFCVYGGGFGEKTNVLNTDVYVTIPSERPGVTLPHGYTLDQFLDHQSFFDIAGGGYSGDIGYWVTKSGTPVSEIDISVAPYTVGAVINADEVAKLYDHYVGGLCSVVIDDYTYARKVIGGGFYGSCRAVNTHVRCGSLRQVYGGSLLGYVHDKALLQFGNRTEDFIGEVTDASGKTEYVINSYKAPVAGATAFRGDVTDVPADVWAEAQSIARSYNDYIFITENIYGGNDVKGIIGTQKWVGVDGKYGLDAYDNAPLFCTNIDRTEEKGIVFNIYGGTFMGDVYGAGNGHYRGYYVPSWVRYEDGPARMYRQLKEGNETRNKGRVYRSRPMVGSVNIQIRGNSETDSVRIRGNFFGGGRECTIGQYNTFLPFEDPRRLEKGGSLNVNIGGYVNIAGNLYMGSEGQNYTKQHTLPDGIDLKTFDGSTTAALQRLGDAAYDHWYFKIDPSHAKGGYYVPGYPAPGEVDGNFGLTGEHMFRSYMKNVEMEGDVELTFYRYLYQRDAEGNYLYHPDPEDSSQPLVDATGTKVRKRKHWQPFETAITNYDAQCINIHSFFLGGLSGSMTNNTVMIYNYEDQSSYTEEERDALIAGGTAEDKLEKWGSVYRITLPKGVTIRENVVLGSENATVKYYPFNSDYTQVIQTQKIDDVDVDSPTYVYEGGMVTQSPMSFDLMVYNDYRGLLTPTRSLPADFYTSSNSQYVEIRKKQEHTVLNGPHAGTTIYRFKYDRTGHSFTNFKTGDNDFCADRYGMAVTKDGEKVSAYIGVREVRRESGLGTDDPIIANRQTMAKLGINCMFDPLVAAGGSAEDHSTHYGGNIYGGCYNSGLVIGDVVLNISSDLLGHHLEGHDEEIFSEYNSLKYNFGRVFGGGYGKDSRIEGDTYVNLITGFCGTNVFGGGMEGPVSGTAHVRYLGDESRSYVYGSIYGGGLRGSVGTEDVTEISTKVNLVSGNVRHVYGGSCMGDVYGRTFVEAVDEASINFSHLDLAKIKASLIEGWGQSRLIVGTLFGGNDISGNIIPYSGNIIPYSGTSTPSSPPALEDFGIGYTTSVLVHEIQNDPSYDGKDSPGSDNGYNGFPLIGNLYGGSNSDYGVLGETKYLEGEVEIATGVGTNTITVPLAGDPGHGVAALDIPHVEKAILHLHGGTVINGYGGGNMSTITQQLMIDVDYPKAAENARAGFKKAEEFDRVWKVLQLSSDQQQDEVTTENADGQTIFFHQIYRLFGGNDNADMAIQPTWALKSAHIGSLYSGGNFGKMTYFDPEYSYSGTWPRMPSGPDDHAFNWQAQGLTLTINSDDIIIGNVYGGGRVGDVSPDIPVSYSLSDKFFGTTLNIVRGDIEHVYGGNDVAGYVYRGTNVNIYGAISGDVYSAGNGNYLYRYDRQANLYDYRIPRLRIVRESYKYASDEYRGARYFVLPALADYGFDINTLDGDGHGTYNANDAQTILAINSYRPNVERTLLHIAGFEDKPVWIRGNVYCGGNSSTIVPKSGDPDYDVELLIGSHVRINGAFMGSNGYELSQGPTMILNTEKLNGIGTGALDVTAPNPLTQADITNGLIPESEADVLNKNLYPTLLDLYMRAVEVVETPKNFSFPDNLTDAYIGDFCVGGNRGSMMTSKTIDLEFPETLIIYGRIIGGCKDANVTYKGVTHIGGLTHPLHASANGDKLNLKIRSSFRPLSLLYPDVALSSNISLNDYMVDINGNSIMIANPEFDPEHPSDHPEFIVNPEVKAEDRFYHDEQCNVYGGCFTSGTTIGNINISLYSDMLRYDEPNCVDKQAVINGINDVKSWRSFTVIGGGYGADTEVRGDICVSLLPNVTTEGVKLPSVASVFAGSQEGLVVGNTTLALRSGKVLADAYGASEAAVMYGSTQVIVGYPRYYRATVPGVYKVKRVDYMSQTVRENIRNDKGEIVVPHTIAYKVGDIVPANIYEKLVGKVDIATLDGFELGSDVPDASLLAFSMTNPISNYFEEVKLGDLGDKHSPSPTDFGAKWDDITVWIGDQKSNSYPAAPYYGHGNLYGGGYVPNSSNIALTGAYTVLRYTKDFHPYNYGMDVPADYVPADDHTYVGYGGNASVMIWDNQENADMNLNLDSGYTADGSRLVDHIHLGTGRYKRKETISVGASRMGLYVYDAEKELYVYQTAGEITDDDVTNGVAFYEKNADGGVYGGGRKVYVEGFRSIDLAYYGYAQHSPQKPKLLNTLQRSDVATVTDCCMELVGASDFTIDDPNNTLYAINRVGELRMTSTLDPNQPLVAGEADRDHSNIINHTARRSRNYIAFYYAVNHLGAFSSNWIFEGKYHNKNGVVTTEASTDPYSTSGVSSFVSHKHDIIDLYEKYIAYKRTPTDDNMTAIVTAYYAYCGSHTDEVEDTVPKQDTIDADYFSRVCDDVVKLFNKRNVATSANMIGINSGYALRIESTNKDGVYYGPVYGVTEIKLLTVAIGEGGGYLYALNHHYDKDVDSSSVGMDTNDWCSEYGHDFLMTTGNFVFPGAAYFLEESPGDRRYNFIVDDCYPMNKGYYDYEAEHMAAHARHRVAGDFNVNNTQEIHYWYISGNTYTFNVNVTGITSDKPQNFYLNNEDDMVNLVNAMPGAEITVRSVKWFKHNDGETDPDSCDIRNLSREYSLYFTVDHDSRNTYSYTAGSTPDGAYVAAIPRTNYQLNDDGSESRIDDVGPDPTDPNAGTGVFGDYIDAEGASCTNNPRLGIRLADNCKNRLEDQAPAAGRKYYADYLETPHQVQVVLECQNPGESVKFTYVVNLTIEYMLGPLIYGDIEIENCALPGEYIYANANNVYVDVDGENFGIVKQYWKLYPNDKNGHRIDALMRSLSDENYVLDVDGNVIKDSDDKPIESTPVYEDMSLWGMYSLDYTEKAVHLPAYWYQNGWELTYIVNVNGFEFESSLPFDYTVEEEDPAHPGSMIPVKKQSRLLVHNYHRMKPVYTGSLAGLDDAQRDRLLLEPGILDLKLVEGARIYIEDDDDQEYFFRYLKMMQNDDQQEISALGQRINPRYAEGLDFYQMSNTTLRNSTLGSGEIVFKGTYHGRGYHTVIPEDMTIKFVNQGSFYNMGFVSLVNKDDTKVFYNSQGTLANCYYFNIYEKGCFLGGGTKAELGLLPGHRVQNCYQNTLTQQQITEAGYEYNEMLHLSTSGFRYGQAAYNLNGFYLQKRHLLLHNAGAANNQFALLQKDQERRLSPEYEDYSIPYVENIYKNGDYRYAYWKEAEGDGHFAMALRTAESPNYLDYLGQHANSKNVSMHKYTHDKDLTRWCDTHQCYHPNFESDYIFFGEDLSVTLDDANEELPQPYNETNRVYRVGGFYGSAADKGYYLNQVGYADAPNLTAIDFVGYRDREIYDSYGLKGEHGTLNSAYRSSIESTGWVINPGWYEMFMPPAVDVPWTWTQADGSDVQHNFKGFDVDSKAVTHNLLVYTEDWDAAMLEMSKFHYTDDAEAHRVQLGISDHSFAEHSDAGIRAHHIIDYFADPAGPKVYGDFLHLVDNQAFNAPVAFRASQAWLTRQPQDYADEYSDSEGYLYKTAWEGICLPYNVAKTYASSTDVVVQKDDIGEITHFSGDYWRGHEYWLRRLSGTSGDKMLFERPQVGNDTPANAGGAKDFTSDYHFTNDMLYQLYKEFEYDETGVADHHHDELYHDPSGSLDRIITGYRHLSASIPYIVAYPGERYYEFDLSGEFYCKMNPRVLTPVPQTITYFGKQNYVAGTYMTIPVTDTKSMAEYKYGDITIKGTFKNVTNDKDMSAHALYDYETNLGVLDVYYPEAIDPITDEPGVEVHHGEEFVKAADHAVIRPFHVYAVKAGGFGAPRRIASGDKKETAPEDVDPEDPQTPEEEMVPGVKIWVEGKTLVVQTPADADFYIYNMLGQRVRHIRSYAGVNRYSGLPSGVFIINRFKFKI